MLYLLSAQMRNIVTNKCSTMQRTRQRILGLQRIHGNMDVTAHKYLVQHLWHVWPVQLVEPTANSRHCQSLDTMPLAVAQSALETVTQVAEHRLVKVAILGDKVVDVAVTTTQNSNFANTDVWTNDNYNSQSTSQHWIIPHKQSHSWTHYGTKLKSGLKFSINHSITMLSYEWSWWAMQHAMYTKVAEKQD